MHDATFWQPLALGQIARREGSPDPGEDSDASSTRNGGTFAASRFRRSGKGLPIDPGPPPIGDPSSAAYKQAAVNVIRSTAQWQLEPLHRP